MLACAVLGGSNSVVARALGVSRPTVIAWRGRFAAKRLDGLLDEPRLGAPRTITNAQPKPFIWTKSADDILAAVARFCERTPNSHH